MVRKDDKYNRRYWTVNLPTELVSQTHWKLYDELRKEYLNENDIALDVGCGSGGGTALLATKCKYVVGIDPDKKAIDYANKNNKTDKIEYIQSSIEDFSTDMKFDFITIMAVIEHIDNERLAVDKCLDLLNPGGLLVIYWNTVNYTEKEILERLKGLKYILKRIDKVVLGHIAYWSLMYNDKA